MLQNFDRKESDESVEPLVDMISCAASALQSNTAKLEQEYQANKRLKVAHDALAAQVESYRTPALARARERFGGGTTPAPTPTKTTAPTPSSSQWKPSQPPAPRRDMPMGMRQVQVGGGMQARNPGFWKEMGLTGQAKTGMGWFDSKGLVGKQYFGDGRKPATLPTATGTV